MHGNKNDGNFKVCNDIRVYSSFWYTEHLCTTLDCSNKELIQISYGNTLDILQADEHVLY